MKRIRVFAVIMALVAAVVVAPVATPAPAHAAVQTITNGAPFLDTSGNHIQAHAAGVIQVGQYYYWFGESRNPDNTFKAVTVYRSTDLKSWEFRGNALQASSAAELTPSFIERPKVIYNETTRQFVMWMHWENGVNYHEGRVAVATSSTVDGSYSYQGSFRPMGYESRDMTVYKDDDGSAYLFSSTAIPSTNASTAIFKLNSSYTNVESFVGLRWENQYREAPTIFKRNGVYFMLSSGTSGWSPNQTKYATATSITGTWTNPVDVGDSTSNRSQPTYVLTISGTAGTSYLYMGDRWAGANDGSVNESTYVWQPLSFPTNTTLSMPSASRIAIDAAAGTVWATAPTPSSSIRSSHSSLCVNVKDDSVKIGGVIVQWDCNGGANSQFSRTDVGSGYVQFMAKHSGLCLAQSSGGSGGGAVTQVSCASGAATNWQLVGSTIRNRQSGACLDLPDWSTTWGKELGTYTCNGGGNQNWTL